MEIENNFRPIIIFTPSLLAGAEKVVITGTNALSELGLDPHLIVIKESRAPHFADHFIKEFSSNVKMTVIESKKAFDFKLPKKIDALLKKETKNVLIHTHGFKALIVCQLLTSKCLRLHTHHGNTSHTLKMRIYEWMADFSMKRCHRVIAVSDEMKEKLLKELAPYQLISTVSNMLSFNNADQIRSYRKSRLLNKKIHLIYVGRLSPEKGLLPFLENFLSFEYKDQFTLSILGDGPQKEEAQLFVKNNQLDDCIHFLGHVPHPSDYLKNADALILPSFTEGLPMTLIESLASGIPVIANDVGAIKELIISHKNGLIVPNNQRAHWHHALSCIKNEIEVWQNYSSDNAAEIEEKYSAKKWGEKTCEVYKQVISLNANAFD